MTQQISGIHTPCKNCVFAKFDDKTQVDCFLKYLDIYRNNGIEVLEAYDDQQEFFVINDKKCIGYREKKWFESRGLGDASIDEKITKYEQSNFPHYLAVIDLQNLDLIGLQTVCEQLAICTIKPQKLVIIRYKHDNKKFGYDSIESILKKTNISCAWRIQTMLETGIDYNYTLNDIIKNNLRCRFLLDIHKQNTNLQSLIDYVNQKVYKELKNFCACGNLDKSAVIYSSTVFRHAFETGKNILDDTSLYEII